jgi:hypothetical protein
MASNGFYSHFYERVDEARASMGIAAVDTRDESDIMSSYYSMLGVLEAAQAAYFRSHLSEFAVEAPLPR